MSPKPSAASVAFKKAVSVAARSSVAALESGALVLDADPTEDDFWNNLRSVRQALVKGYHDEGAPIDVDAEALNQKLPEALRDELAAQLSHREEAGYLYGLALGLMLGRGSAR